MIDRARVRELAAHDTSLDHLESTLAEIEAEQDAMEAGAPGLPAVADGTGDPLGRVAEIRAGIERAMRVLAEHQEILARQPTSPRNRKVAARINGALGRLQRALERGREFTAAAARAQAQAQNPRDSLLSRAQDRLGCSVIVIP